MRAYDGVLFCRHRADTWWWSGEVKEAIRRKRDIHKSMCRNSTKMNKNRHINVEIRQKEQLQKQRERRLHWGWGLTELNIVQLESLIY